MATSSEESGGLGFAATELAAAFRDLDVAALERLTEAERDEQERARTKLAFHVERIFDEADPRRGGPGGRAAEVAGAMRDLALNLRQDVVDAQSRAGDLG